MHVHVQNLLYISTSSDSHGTWPSSTSASRRTTSGAPAPSQLAQLRADEHIIQLRKFNVMRFGAGWLRPPGVTKTLQSKLEEAQEHLEQMEMQRRDAALRAQEEAAAHAAGRPVGFDGTLPDQEERDLDAEVPDGDGSTIASDDEAENTANVTFHEESLVQGSPAVLRRVALQMEDAELDGRLQDERDMAMEGDLDDDVPEAGSYEHTDTEDEDDSSSDEDAIELQPPLSQMRSPARRNAGIRLSIRSDNSETLASSSFIDTSPAILRRGARANNANVRGHGSHE